MELDIDIPFNVVIKNQDNDTHTGPSSVPLTSAWQHFGKKRMAKEPNGEEKLPKILTG